MKKTEKMGGCTMSMPFEPEEIDDLDESLLETMDREELADFRDALQETLDQMMTLEPDPDRNEEAYSGLFCLWTDGS
jgi:hypothetical protein